MGQLQQFIINHWALWLALTSILILILINEISAQKSRATELSPQAAVGLINHEDALVFDFRDAESYQKGHIINALRVNEDEFSNKKMDKYKDKTLILVCAKGLQSTPIAAKLRKEGFTKVNTIAGGIASWQNADLPLVKGK